MSTKGKRIQLTIPAFQKLVAELVKQRTVNVRMVLPSYFPNQYYKYIN